MKIKIIKNDEYRHSPARFQAFTAGSVLEIPKDTTREAADELIKRNSAALVEPKSKKDS
ncbi:MAG: hypothetical protein JKY94_08040 [Rhodobacteraceae bacterium]|nr:hypothetical protein [Paracoccaceae bacterium]